MKTVEDYEAIRRAYFIEQLSIRAIRRKLGYDRDTIRKAITHAGPPGHQLKEPRPARVLGPYQAKIKGLLDESDQQRAKRAIIAVAHRILIAIYHMLSKHNRGTSWALYISMNTTRAACSIA